VLGPLVQFLTAVSDSNKDYCLMRGTVPAGVVVPLHSHAERETFYVLEEEVQGLGRITGSRSVLVTYSMCLAVSGTVGGTYLARLCHYSS